MKTKSSLMISVVILLMIALSSGGLYTIYVTNTIKPDAEMINKLGVIRGSIQRIVKLEAGGIVSDGLINAIDSDIREFYDKKIEVYDKNDEIHKSLHSLLQLWLQMKEQILAYRESRSESNLRILLERSEVLWDEANSMVLVSQIVSERKLTNYKISYTLFGFNLLLGFIIAFLIKMYVRDSLERLVNFDEMTGIYNRRHFNKDLNNEISRTERYNTEFSLIMFDIDHFKHINDTYGHSAGDSVLKELSSLVKANIRKSDALYRIGGEEFAILAPETAGDSAYALSEKMRTTVEKHGFRYAGTVNISLGITQFTSGDCLDSIYKRADQALYKAKNGGRNRSETV